MTNIKRIVLILLVLVTVLLLLTGCSNEYEKFSVKFKDIYLEISKAVDITDTLKTLENIQSNDNKNKIEELRILLENIKDKVPTDKKDEYERYNNWYKGLVLLKDTPYSEWDKLSFNEKSNIWTEIGLINIRRE